MSNLGLDRGRVCRVPPHGYALGTLVASAEALPATIRYTRSPSVFSLVSRDCGQIQIIIPPQPLVIPPQPPTLIPLAHGQVWVEQFPNTSQQACAQAPVGVPFGQVRGVHGPQPDDRGSCVTTAPARGREPGTPFAR